MQTKVILLRSISSRSIFFVSADHGTSTKIWRHVSWYLKTRLLQVHYATHTSDVETHRRVAGHIGKFDTMLGSVKKSTVRWRGHVVRAKGAQKTSYHRCQHQRTKKRDRADEKA